MAAIGIDFGNTYCRVGIFRSNNAFEIIPSETQSRQTPCYVSFKSWSDTIVGDLALNRVVENIEATFFCPKRLIGRSYEEITQQIRHSHWPFRVKDGGEKRPVFQVAYQDMERDIHPIEVYSAVLYKVRELASNYLQENVVRAVITIPINCGESFVKDALKSAEMAGFTEVNLIEKPLSATIAYSISATKCNAQYVIAVHLGGGSLGVSVVNISPNGIKPIFSDGDPNIGGVNIDAAIVTWLQQKLNILPDPSGQTSMHLSILCERAKKNLSSCKETSIKLDDVAGKDDIIRITQDDITEMEDVQKMLGKMKNIMKRAMSAISSTERAAVILVGGSTRLKCVRDVIDSFGIKSNRILSAEEVAVHGAAVLAAKLWPIQSPTDAASDLINIQLLTTIPWKANQLVTGCPQSSQTTYIDDQSKDLGDRSALLNDIESNIYEIQRIIRGELDAKKKEDVTQKCKMALDWLKRDPIPTMNEITKVKDKVERWKSDVDKEMSASLQQRQQQPPRPALLHSESPKDPPKRQNGVGDATKKQPPQQPQPTAANQLVGGQQDPTYEECCKKLEQLEKANMQHLDSLQMNSKQIAQYQELKLKHQLVSTQVQKDVLYQMHLDNERCLELLSQQKTSIYRAAQYGNQMVQLQQSCSGAEQELIRSFIVELQYAHSLNFQCKEILENRQRSGIRSQFEFTSKLFQFKDTQDT